MDRDQQKYFQTVDLLLRLGFLFLILACCFQILRPFVGVLLWSLILSIAFRPLHDRLSKILRSKKIASIIYLLLFLSALILGAWLFLGQIISSITDLAKDFTNGNIKIPPPTEAVASWPLIGEDLYVLWNEAAQGIEQFLTNHKDQLLVFVDNILNGVKSVGQSLVTIILAILISAALLSGEKWEKFGHTFFSRLMGSRGDRYLNIISKTTSSVAKGLIGVALIQSFLVGLGLIGAKVPYAGVWALIVLLMAILQLPVIVMVVLFCLWIFNTLPLGLAIAWSIYLVLSGLANAPLKALLLGRGTSVPMLVIFLGVIGGFIAFGFIGLFTGAIILAVAYSLLTSWLQEKHEV